MHYAMCVQMSNWAEHLLHDLCGMMLTKFLGCNYAVKKFPTFAIFHNDVHVAVVYVALVKLNNVGMIYFLENSQFFF